MKTFRILAFIFLYITFFNNYATAQTIPSPKEHFGFSVGDDYCLPNFTQTEAYFKRLAATSDRIRYVDIGITEEGRHQPMLIISSPANLANLDRYKAISKELALAENPDTDSARALAAEGRAIVWISGGLHASEHLGVSQLIETAWLFATRNDPETLHILDNVILLLTHDNPDGQDLLANWYNRRPDPQTRVRDTPPILYQKYAGHDANRDFYINNLKETANINRQLYIEWFPQIIYDHHQGGDRGLPYGTIVSTLPWRDPFNYNIDPLVVVQSHAVGSAMHTRWISENMPGTAMRSVSTFMLWRNGGLGVTGYYHNMIGVVTETAGCPTPVQIPLVPSRQIPTLDFPWPAPPQLWHFRQSVDYALEANYAVLDYAFRNRDQLLFNIYRMGRNAIERGSRDHWTRQPSHVEAMKTAAAQDAADKARESGKQAPIFSASDPIDPSFFAVMQRPEIRDPRAFIVTADPAVQHDRAAVAKFINALSLSGIIIHKATESFSIGNKIYPKESYVITTAQAFRSHILDMFEPQEYPRDFLPADAPFATETSDRPVSSTAMAPYDAAGWTLALQMGIAFDRILDALPDSLPLERLPHGQLVVPYPGVIATTTDNDSVAGYLVSHSPNHSFTLANRLLKANAPVFWLSGDTTATKTDPGTLYIPASPTSIPIVTRAVAELGLDALSLATTPVDTHALKLAPTRIALWDRYSGSVPSGWVRLLLEQYEYDFDLIYVQQIDESENLRNRYDVIIFANDAIPPRPSDNLPSPRTSPNPSTQPKLENVPEQFHHLLGYITEEKTIPILRRFLEQGGTIVTIGSSTCLGYYLDLPVGNALLETLPNGKQRLFPRNKFCIPGSILRAQFDPTVPLAWGMDKSGPVVFDRNPLFSLSPEAAAYGVRAAAWLDKGDYLLSGLVQDKRPNNAESILAIEAPVGKGTLYLLAPEVTLRAQPHATFKLLFNPLHLATASEKNISQP